MRRGVGVIDRQRGFVMRDGVIEDAVFEQEVSDVHHDGHATFVRVECCGKGGDCRQTVTALQICEAAFVVHERPLAAARCNRERSVKVG
jgi:hypothetical protein